MNKETNMKSEALQHRKLIDKHCSTAVRRAHKAKASPRALSPAFEAKGKV